MNKSKKSRAPKSLPFKVTENVEEHSYATPMEVASSNKRDRSSVTPTYTPEKIQMEKKPKGTSSDESTERPDTGGLAVQTGAVAENQAGKAAGFRGPYGFIEGKRILAGVAGLE